LNSANIHIVESLTLVSFILLAFRVDESAEWFLTWMPSRHSI